AVVLLGPNGAGKTTLLRILALLLRPGGGRLALFGTDARAAPPALRRRIGYVGHESLCYPDLTAAENLAFYARLFDVPDAGARIGELIAWRGSRRPLAARCAPTRAAWRSGSRSHARCCTGRTSSSSTSPSPASTPRRSRRCSTAWASCAPRAMPSCSPHTTSSAPHRSRPGSPSSTAGASHGRRRARPSPWWSPRRGRPSSWVAPDHARCARHPREGPAHRVAHAREPGERLRARRAPPGGPHRGARPHARGGARARARGPVGELRFHRPRRRPARLSPRARERLP